MATHYDILGVGADASVDDLRRAYHDRARALHPDRVGAADVEASQRAMQDVNEAWRVLRDPQRRAAYDRRLAGGPAPGPSAAPGGIPDLDRPYHPAVAGQGDLSLSIVRSLPWLVVLLVLGTIFVFTAFAGGNAGPVDETEPPADAAQLIGRCIASGAGGVNAVVPCTQDNEGRVELVVARASVCPSGTLARPFRADGTWLCLRTVGADG